MQSWRGGGTFSQLITPSRKPEKVPEGVGGLLDLDLYRPQGRGSRTPCSGLSQSPVPLPGSQPLTSALLSSSEHTGSLRALSSGPAFSCAQLSPGKILPGDSYCLDKLPHQKEMFPSGGLVWGKPELKPISHRGQGGGCVSVPQGDIYQVFQACWALPRPLHPQAHFDIFQQILNFRISKTIALSYWDSLEMERS